VQRAVSKGGKKTKFLSINNHSDKNYGEYVWGCRHSLWSKNLDPKILEQKSAKREKKYRGEKDHLGIKAQLPGETKRGGMGGIR